MSTVAEKNPEQLPTVIDAVVKSGEEATTEKKNRIVIGLENVKNVVSGAADWAGDTINGVGDAFVVLNQMSKAVSNAYKEGNVQDGRIKEGAPGSLSNPINTKFWPVNISRIIFNNFYIVYNFCKRSNSIL